MFHELDQLRDELVAAHPELAFGDFTLSAGYEPDRQMYWAKVAVLARRNDSDPWVPVGAVHYATERTVHLSVGTAVYAFVRRTAVGLLRQKLHELAVAPELERMAKRTGYRPCEICRTNGRSSTCPQCYGRGSVRVDGPELFQRGTEPLPEPPTMAEVTQQGLDGVRRTLQHLRPEEELNAAGLGNDSEIWNATVRPVDAGPETPGLPIGAQRHKCPLCHGSTQAPKRTTASTVHCPACTTVFPWGVFDHPVKRVDCEPCHGSGWRKRGRGMAVECSDCKGTGGRVVAS